MLPPKLVSLSVSLDGDNAWPDMADKTILTTSEGIKVALIDRGMESGRPSVVIRVDLPTTNRVVLAQTSARLFCTAAKMIMAKYPGLFDGD